MNEIVTDNFRKRQDKLLDTDYYDMLSKEEKELFDSSNFKKVQNWLRSLYKIPAKVWLDWKIFDQKRQKSSPKVRQKPAPLPTYRDIKLAREKAKNIKT